LKQKTLCFLVQGSPPQSILLGYKKRGFGAGKYAGIGGGIEPGESIQAAAIRELQEETQVVAQEEDLVFCGSLTFVFPSRRDWSQIVHVFRISRWQGSPQETEEMLPEWFSTQAIPYSKMWQDNAIWLPRLLAGQPVTATFTFDADNEAVLAYQFER
jgi:8-oxo-dGTP diphosphatase